MPTRRAVRASALLLLLAVAACDGLSKEQRRTIRDIQEAVERDPARIDAPWEQGLPPLHLAVLDGLPSLLTWLLDHGASRNVRDARGQTGLHLAVFSNRTPDRWFIRTLVRRGADVNAARPDGTTPLHTAAAVGAIATAEALLDVGASPRAVANDGATPLHAAATPQPDRSPVDCRRFVELLVAHGAAVDAPDHYGRTPLFMAALLGHGPAIQALLDAGADPNREGPAGWAALQVATLSGKPEAVELLLARGADVNHRDAEGRTPLALARQRAEDRRGNAPPTAALEAVIEVLRRHGGA